MKCPRCKETLQNESVDGENIDICKSCGGMWLHKHQLDNLLKESEGEVELCSIDENSHEDNYPDIKCRECDNVTMKKINFLDYSDIIFEHCPSCGAFWVDKHELENMHSYIKKVENESHEVKNKTGYNILERISRIAYNIFH